MSHTPGPWIVADQCRVKTQAGATVALPVSNAAKDPETFQANARLIAAAPDMLGALHRIAYCLEDECDGCDYEEKMLKAEEIAVQAIARATGQEE